MTDNFRNSYNHLEVVGSYEKTNAAFSCMRKL